MKYIIRRESNKVRKIILDKKYLTHTKLVTPMPYIDAIPVGFSIEMSEYELEVNRFLSNIPINKDFNDIANSDIVKFIINTPLYRRYSKEKQLYAEEWIVEINSMEELQTLISNINAEIKINKRTITICDKY